MNKKCLKCIMELIFIFILPLGIILASISCEKAMTYDENGNQLTEKKHIEYNNVILNEGTGNWINKLKVNEQFKNNSSNWLGSGGTITDWYCTGLSFINNSTYITMTNSANSYAQMVQTIQVTNGHKYLFKLDIQTLNLPNNAFYIMGFANMIYLNADFNRRIYTEFITMGNYSSIQITLKQSTTTQQSSYIYSIELIDLTDMFGSGYEPTTIEEYNAYVNNQVFNYTQNGDEIEYISSSQISENAEEDLTIWGKIKNLIIDNLQLTDNIIVDIILSYTIIWFIMFIIWHFFYLFFDGLVHVFIDWGHKEKEKVK